MPSLYGILAGLALGRWGVIGLFTWVFGIGIAGQIVAANTSEGSDNVAAIILSFGLFAWAMWRPAESEAKRGFLRALRLLIAICMVVTGMVGSVFFAFHGFGCPHSHAQVRLKMCIIKRDENMQTSALNTRLANVYDRAEKCRDRRTSDELQRAVLHTGERLLTAIPDQNILEPALDRETETYATGTPDQRLAGVAKLAGLFIELDYVGYAKLTHIERHTCRALVARHDAAEGRGNRVIDLFNL